jgi:hypothetical protein
MRGLSSQFYHWKILSCLYVSMCAFHSAYSSTIFNFLDFMNFRFEIFKKLS